MNRAGYTEDADDTVQAFIPTDGKLAYTIPEACAATGVGKSTLYEHRAKGRLQMGKLCGRTVIETGELSRWFWSEFAPIEPKRAA